ncbi:MULTISPECIES: condensation domain-containing protein [Streptacidiphilus]|uniref:Condensation domain-containing protein n=1 Tax=Streptacidiphilus cavernicola TaxID=3342716 RepID=A0ABV6UJ54_9ACTN|nr:condensation domain-containing protein [Streptacidiphilus jeojiense]
MDPIHHPSTYYQRDWFSACRDARSWFSTPVAWNLTGALDPAALTRALESLTGRHDALRTSFRSRADDVDQVVWPTVQIDLRTVDLFGAPRPEAAVDDRIVVESGRLRLLDSPPLWHGLLFRLGPRRHVLALFIHHLVFDGWSHGVLRDELVRCYRAEATGRPVRLPPLRVQPGRFAQWERGHRDPAAEAWWHDRLAALPPLSPLPQVGGHFVSRAIPDVPWEAMVTLGRLAQAEGVGVGAVLLAVLLAARRPVTGDDVVIGMTRAGRDRPELQRVVGPLLDHVPVRVDLSGRPPFRELLHRVHRAHREAMAHQLPLGLIRRVVPEDLGPRGGRLYDTRYNYLPYGSARSGVITAPGGELTVTDRALEPTRLAPRHTEDHPEVLPLSYVLRHQRDGALRGEVCVHDGLYSAARTAELAESFSTALVRVAREEAVQPLPARPPTVAPAGAPAGVRHRDAAR